MDNKPGISENRKPLTDALKAPYWNEPYITSRTYKNLFSILGIDVVFLRKDSLSGGTQQTFEIHWKLKADKTRTWSTTFLSEVSVMKKFESTCSMCERILAADLEDLPTFLSENLGDTETYVLQWRLGNQIQKSTVQGK